MAKPQITATICTHNRAGWLEKCLEGFIAQTADKDDFEILIVDNASTDDTHGVFIRYQEQLPNLRYCHEPELGLSAARNCGLNNSRAEIVAYIDDDARPFTDWVERLLNAFHNTTPTPAAVGGEVEPEWGCTPPAWTNKPVYRHLLTAGLGWSDKPTFIKPPQWICEVNSAYQKRVLQEYGPWPTDLGRKGGLLLSNENIINEKMVDADEPILFDPTVRVYHHIHAERLTQSWFCKRIFWQGVSEGIINNSHGGSVQLQHERTLRLPASDEAWKETFTEAIELRDMEERCETLQSLGYLLARTGFFDGI